jgi:uncharacterized phage infection (PIP) family protein YhgE
MRKHDKTTGEFDEFTKTFLPEESEEQATAVAIELRHRLNKVEQQVQALYTSMAAYATIAQQNVDTARAEARADTDRAQATLIGLTEKLRNEMLARMSGADHRAAPLATMASDGNDRMADLEDKLSTMASALEIYARENAALKEHVSTLMAERMAAEGWLLGDPTLGDLSLR